MEQIKIEEDLKKGYVERKIEDIDKDIEELLECPEKLNRLLRDIYG